MTRVFKNFVFAMLLLPIAACQAEGDSPKYEAGTHYQVLEQPVRTVDPNKIEVTEVFWYGCSHCYRFEPVINSWAETLPDDVDFERSPAIWHPTMELHARAYYTAKALGVLEELHKPIFEAMNLKKNHLETEEKIADLFAEHGVDKEKFSKVFNSFGVNAATRQADARQRSYHIQGTPELIVNGKYRINGKMAGSHKGMTQIAEYLVDMERRAKASN